MTLLLTGSLVLCIGTAIMVKKNRSNPQYVYADNDELKAYVLDGDYQKICQNLQETSSYHELMIAAELYMGGFVEDSDFSENYADYKERELQLLKQELEYFYQKKSEGMSKVESKKLKQRVDALIRQIENPKLLKIKEQLLKAAELYCGSDQTKVYLEISKIQQFFGNETEANRYLSKAIYSSSDSKDETYADAMSQLIDIIENDEETALENIKNVSMYVKMLMAHALTVDIEEVLALASGQMSRDGSAEEYTAFEQLVIDYITKARSAVNISEIDTSGFEMITARVQILSDYITRTAMLKNAIQIYDCGVEIKEFTLQQMDDIGTNIMLICDISDSMERNIHDLRSAVMTFITDKEESENLAIITFNEDIVAALNFGTSDKEMLTFAESMTAEGRTDIFSAMVNGIQMFPNDSGKNNVIILMTDGQDNHPRTAAEIYEQIGVPAQQKGITIYTIGLGNSADLVYLNTIAESGNGEFLYVSDSISLSAFYDRLHQQLNYWYQITYKAEDTDTVFERILEVCVPEEHIGDEKLYTLMGIEQPQNILPVKKQENSNNMAFLELAETSVTKAIWLMKLNEIILQIAICLVFFILIVFLYIFIIY